MREIKFRAWMNGRYHRFEFGGYEDEYDNLYFTHSEDMTNHDNWIKGYPLDFPVEQYTGLHDKNGKEIYEGDIIGYRETQFRDTYNTEIVEWSDEFPGFDPFVTYDCDCDIYVDMATVEVIGNIHENPELLK